MTQPPAPKEVLKVILCKCKTGCSTARCCCNQVGMKCTDLCSCGKNCENKEHSGEDKESETNSDFSDCDM
jgi:hypothetical protein